MDDRYPPEPPAAPLDPLDPLELPDAADDELEEPLPPRRPLARRRRRSRGLRWLLGLLLLAIAFAGGLALGRALEQAPRPGGTITQQRTLVPETIGPTKIVTVTVPG